LDGQRTVVAGSSATLCDAIRRGADLRIRTDFVFNEHIDTKSNNSEPVVEVSDFRVTYLIEDRWAAGIMSLRMPICPPDGFGPQASMSFFMYNQDGQQAIARPYLDGAPAEGVPGASPLDDHSDMPKYHQHDNWDADTNAPSSNFIYDFDLYRFLVRDEWEEVFAHTADGKTEFGSIDALYDAFREQPCRSSHQATPNGRRNRSRARSHRICPDRAGLLLHRAKAFQRRLSTGRPRSTEHSPAIRERKLGFRLADAADRWFCRPVAVRSLHASVPEERKPPRHPLVRAVTGSPGFTTAVSRVTLGPAPRALSSPGICCHARTHLSSLGKPHDRKNGVRGRPDDLLDDGLYHRRPAGRAVGPDVQP
jgi:hypothetical protein